MVRVRIRLGFGFGLWLWSNLAAPAEQVGVAHRAVVEVDKHDPLDVDGEAAEHRVHLR